MQSYSRRRRQLHADRDLPRSAPISNFAQVLVQNRVSSRAVARCRRRCRAQGVTVQKKSTAILLFVTLTSPDDRYDSLYLEQLRHHPAEGRTGAAAGRRQRQRVRRRPVFDAGLARPGKDAGARPQHAGRDLRRCSSRASRSPPGRSACRRRRPARHSNTPSTSTGRLSDPAQFADVIVKTGIRRRHHAGARRRPGRTRRADLQPGVHPRRQAGRRHRDLPVCRAPTRSMSATRFATEDGAACARLSPRASSTTCRSTPRSSSTGRSTRSTRRCIEAAVLVLIVILVFLQDWRAMLVPATTVPVTIIGAFAAMAALGFTVNLSTLFAIVLAIGIVVDDAIVVVEGAAHNIEKGMSGHDAAIARHGRAVGADHRHHAGADVGVPARGVPARTDRAHVCAVRAGDRRDRAAERHQRGRRSSRRNARCGCARRSRRNSATSSTAASTRSMAGWSAATPALIARHGARIAAPWWSLALAIIGAGVLRLRAGRRPASCRSRTRAICSPACSCPTAPRWSAPRKCSTRSTEIARATPGRRRRSSPLPASPRSTTTRRSPMPASPISCSRIGASAARDRICARLFVGLNAFAGRDRGGAQSWCCRRRRSRASAMRAGFTMQIELRDGSFDLAKLQSARSMRSSPMRRPSRACSGSSAPFRSDGAAIHDRGRPGEGRRRLHVTLDQVFSTLAAYLGSTYVDQFNKFGRIFQVYAQADAQFRLRPDDIAQSDGAQRAGRHDPARHAGASSSRPSGRR